MYDGKVAREIFANNGAITPGSYVWSLTNGDDAKEFLVDVCSSGDREFEKAAVLAVEDFNAHASLNWRLKSSAVPSMAGEGDGAGLLALYVTLERAGEMKLLSAAAINGLRELIREAAQVVCSMEGSKATSAEKTVLGWVLGNAQPDSETLVAAVKEIGAQGNTDFVTSLHAHQLCANKALIPLRNELYRAHTSGEDGEKVREIFWRIEKTEKEVRFCTGVLAETHKIVRSEMKSLEEMVTASRAKFGATASSLEIERKMARLRQGMKCPTCIHR